MTKDTALKMAIEALLYGTDHTNAVKACKEALEQPEIGDAEIKQMLNDIEYYQKRVEELEQPAQIGCVQHDCSECKKASEPVAWIAVDKISGEYMLEKEKDNGIEWTPLYASPQAREWQKLSDSELEDLKYEYNHGGNGYSMEDIINIACSWLKEKNTPHTNQE
jgi:hypothetical protein